MLKVIGIAWGIMVGSGACLMIGRGFALANNALDNILGVFH
jgi:hypothetical protein